MSTAVEQLLDARMRQVAMAPLPEPVRPRDAQAAYRLQRDLHRGMAAAGLGAIAGHKIGCTTRVMQSYLGIDTPCAGGILDAMAHHGNGEFAHAGFVRVGVECELAALLGEDLGMPGGKLGRDAVSGAVASIMCAIEVVDDRWQDYRIVDTPSLIADDFFAAGCVLGPPRDDWRTLALDRLTGRMRVNGRVIGAGTGADILGDPLAALEWLANEQAAQGRVLRAGQFVLLGSLVQTCWLQPGDAVEVTVDELGSARARFAA